jgi:predicted extracellular nuclease
VAWAKSKGAATGEPNPDGGALLFNPQGSATRAQAAQMLMSFIENAIKQKD